jgi:uncharacterized protein (DUF433 family)
MAQTSTRIVTTPELLGGEPRIEGRRISVRQIYDWVEEAGLEPQAVADRYDLDVADIYRALTYYHDNPREMQAIRRRRQTIIETNRKKAITGPDDLHNSDSSR